MGRAIDMENDIYKLKQEMEKMNNIIRGMADELSEVAEIVLDKTLSKYFSSTIPASKETLLFPFL